MASDELNSTTSDPILMAKENKTGFALDASVGFYYKYRNQYYLGVSGNEIAQTLNLGNYISDEYKLLRQYYLVSGYTFLVTREWTVEPSLLLKFNELLTYQTDISMTVAYLDDYWLGGSFRTNGDVVWMAGIRSHNFHFAYCLDTGISQIAQHSFGSHELNVGIEIGSGERKQRWRNRYF